MITEKELQAVELSPTARDFYQIWNELLDTAAKLSNRWDPASTNESDPGIVLLKVLTAIADKLNYTIDKNILEAFMPSATQEEAMRKLCDMLGYSMKYYQSATTTVQISYTGDKTFDNIHIPQFTNIKNNDEDINFVTTSSIDLYPDTPMRTVLAIEGANADFETEEVDNKITISLLDDNNRLYLPESQIAENGIFISSVAGDFSENNLWAKVDNLNTQPLKTPCYKFGYDSKQGIPYIQFPDDISAIIGDGIYIHYIRTNGINGNIVARLLNTIEWSDSNTNSNNTTNSDTDSTTTITAADLSVTNIDIANTGRNPETLNEAYNNYKKTIGTFDTLVTCRDYMNKIYQMTESYSDTTPLVSNVIVSDIRDDINRSIELCSFNEYGICYSDYSLTNTSGNLIDHFDLVLYPFRVYNNLNTKDDYKNSFTISDENNTEIIANLEDNKTISHSIKSPSNEEIACIKVYLQLKAKITTTKKVNTIEEKSILEAVKAALFYSFNMRKLDFGEEIPYDSILECIQSADTRIKNVSLDEPILSVKYYLYGDNDDKGHATSDTDDNNGKVAYNKLALRNILAGRIPLFNYEENFKPSYTEKSLNDPSIHALCENVAQLESSFTPSITIPPELKLLDNEVIKFRAPNFRTTVTYPAYVNYYLHLSAGEQSADIEANSEYALKDGEYLLINYTQSGDDGTSKTIKNVVYENKPNKDPIIIRPNFKLEDSAKYRTKHSYSKTSGYKFPTQYNIDGMFSLGTSEQIEIREKIKVELTDSLSYIYWIGNNENIDKAAGKETTTFTFNADNEYELKDNEYFFVTTKDKTNLVWYGKGTVISKQANTPTLIKRLTNNSLTANDILTQGLAAAINWVQVNLSAADGGLIAQEYQYINLVKDDTLYSITIPITKKATKTTDTTLDGAKTYYVQDDNDGTVECTDGHKYTEVDEPILENIGNYYEISDITTLTSEWINCSTASSSVVDSLPTIAIDGISWQVCSLLEINMGPTKPQTLHNNDSIKVYCGTNVPPAEPYETYKSGASLKSNIACQTSAQTVETKFDLDNDGTTDNFMIKAFENKTVNSSTEGASGEPIPLNNFNEHWTTFSFSKNKTEIEDLNILLQSPDFALMMIYYTDETASTTSYTNNAYLTTDNGSLTIYNNIVNNNESWWENGTSGSNYYLRPGINVVKIATSTAITIHADLDTNGTVIFSDLDIIKVNSDGGINPRLHYYRTDEETYQTAMSELLAKINEVDPSHQFYYNTIIENSVAIDLNTLENNSSSENYETLESPRTWYDANNINNKFVISEIDADYLDKGITIAKTSKL